MNVSFNGFGETLATFVAADGVKAGQPVKISANGTVAACAKGDVLCGVAANVRGGFAGVQLGGFVSLPYTGNLALGYQEIVMSDASTVTVPATGSTGRKCLIVELDSAGGMAGIIL